METTGSAAPSPWAGLRVVDLTTAMGTLAVRFLTGFGAVVTRIVPPDGDPLRRTPPFARDPGGEPVSLPWLHLARGRDELALDLDSAAGRAALGALLGDADVVVESQGPGILKGLGLDYDDIGHHFPKLVWTSITPFGRTGPAAGWQGTDLIGLASGGLLSLCGDPDRPPLRPSVEQGYVHAGLQALAGTLVALHARNLTGRGQLVDVSMQEAVATCLGNARLFYEFEGLVTRRAGGGRAYGATGARLVYPCADGHVAFGRTPDAMAPLAAWMRELGFAPLFDPGEWAKLPQSGPGTPGPEKARELEESVVSFFATRPKMSLYEEGQARGIMICPVSAPADLMRNAQLIARGYFEDVALPELGRSIRFPGPPVRMAASPWRSAASPGHAAAPTQPREPSNPLAGSRDILKGVRVADFSWVGVGPLATQTLAWLGADVVRVESSTRYDVFRAGGPQRGAFPDASAYFANCNRDKLGMTLNLKHPRAKEVALRLAAQSDILVESFTPGFFDSVGLTYEEVSAVNPSIIMMSCSMEGLDGPHAQFRGFGLVLQATVGFTHFTSWPDRAPVGTGVAYTDWVATHVASAALLSALEHRRRTGQGQRIDLSQLEACIWALDAELLRYTAQGEQRAPLGNRHPGMTPHGVFPSAGEDHWIAIAVRDDRDWRALCALAGGQLAALAPLDLAGRRASEDAIEAALAGWTGGFEKYALAGALQAAGVPAYPVATMADVEHDTQLRARGHYWPTRHPVIGDADWNGPAYHLSATPLYPERPSPMLGEHNEHVYREVLGYSEAELADLLAEGVLE